jgi:serine/threonine-protein kinase
MGLLRIPAGGGPTELVAGLGNGEVAFNNPQALPGGRAVLFSVDKALGVDRNTIEVLTLADGHRKVVARGGSFPRYLATSSGVGHLVYVNKATLFAISFDLAKLETSGTAVPVVDDIAYQASRGTGQFEGSGQFDFSPAPSGHGTLVYRKASGGGGGMMTLKWVDPTGKIEPLRAKPGVYTNPNLSSDAKRVTLTVSEGGSPDVWVYDLQRDAMTRLTFGGASYRWSTWSPDGQYVVFTSDGNGIFQARADGVRQPQVLTQGKPFQWPWSFTPDGKRLAYFEAAGNYQIWTVPLEETGGQLKAGKPEQFLKNSFNDVFPSFSPDGRWLAYRSNESGKEEVYVRAFPPPSSGQGGKWQISNGGGGVPHWSRSRHDLLYQSGDQIMATSYTVAGDTFVAEKPRVWLAKLGAAPGGIYWDLAPDGKRVLVLTPVDTPEAPKQEHEVVFLENFFDELRRRVPVTK